jgi:hypothetical protein
VPLLRPGKPVQRWQHGGWQRINLQEVFAQALVDNARRALQAQHEASHAPRAGANAQQPGGNGTALADHALPAAGLAADAV